jgi:hypothetical protein
MLLGPVVPPLGVLELLGRALKVPGVAKLVPGSF